jgi:hypothetical protein
LKHPKLWIGCGAGFVVLVVYLSLTPHPLDVPDWWNVKVGHVAAYAWLMLWFAQIYARAPMRFGIAAALLAMGVGLEYAQGMVGRDFSYTDMRDDGIGIAMGWAFALTPLGRVLRDLDA